MKFINKLCLSCFFFIYIRNTKVLHNFIFFFFFFINLKKKKKNKKKSFVLFIFFFFMKNKCRKFLRHHRLRWSIAAYHSAAVQW